MNDNTIFVSKNATKEDIFREVVAHEFTHSIKGTKHYADIEKYIKDNITNNGSVSIVTDDGDHIVINGRTAWKIADVEKWENNVKLPMADGELRTKYEAGAHIDELTGISKSIKKMFRMMEVMNGRMNGITEPYSLKIQKVINTD